MNDLHPRLSLFGSLLRGLDSLDLFVVLFDPSEKLLAAVFESFFLFLVLIRDLALVQLKLTQLSLLLGKPQLERSDVWHPVCCGLLPFLLLLHPLLLASLDGRPLAIRGGGISTGSLLGGRLGGLLSCPLLEHRSHVVLGLLPSLSLLLSRNRWVNLYLRLDLNLRLSLGLRLDLDRNRLHGRARVRLAILRGGLLDSGGNGADGLLAGLRFCALGEGVLGLRGR